MNPLLIGGEMPHWTDTAPAGGPLLRELAATAHGHTLIVGPHGFDVLDALPARHVTALVRGVPDADALAARYASRPGFEVCCGSLEKLAAVPAYDTVLALDGLDRTASTEAADMSWEAGLTALLAVLRPGGQLLLGLANPVGLQHLLGYASPSSDVRWGIPPGDDPTRPAGLDALRNRLRGAGLEVLRDYAAFPSPHHPAALLSEATLTDSDLRGLVSAALRRAGTPPEPTLADPRPIAVQLLNHGLTASLAPGWFLQATRPGAVSTSLPAALVAGSREATSPAEQLTHVAGQGWHLSPTPSPARASGGPSSGGPSFGSGTAMTVPPSRLLHDLLLTAIRGHDLPELRALLTAWQNSEAAAVDAAEILVDTDGHLHALAAPTSPATALHRLATAVLDESPAEPETLTLLYAMAGVDLPPGRPKRPAISAFRELTAAHGRLAQQLSEAQAQSEWYEQRLAARDAELARAYRIISLLKGTVPGRAATAVRGALRTSKRAARTALTHLRPRP